MRVYLLEGLGNSALFASFACVGTWSDDRICSVCGEASARLSEPLQIEWDDGTDQIGDFSWGGYNCVVRDAARSFLESHAFELKFGEVQVVAPTERTRRPRVEFPYRGPTLSWPTPLSRLRLDEERSGVQLLSDCLSCGQRRYTFRRDGIAFRRSTWKGEKIFLVEQFRRSSAMFLTEEGVAALLQGGFSNLSPRLAGEIID